MSNWINLDAVFKIVVFGLLIGAVLPGTFAIGVRLNAEGAGAADHHGAVSAKNPLLVAISYVLFGLVLLAVMLGILFIARDFIGHHTGLYLLGAKPK